jgi:hypothetical protein
LFRLQKNLYIYVTDNTATLQLTFECFSSKLEVISVHVIVCK